MQRAARAFAIAVTLVAASTVCIPAPAGADSVRPYRAGDECDGRCRSILPPGTDGNHNLPEVLAFVGSGAKPPHTDDQLGPYRDLVYDYRGIRPAGVEKYFKDHSFGVPPDKVASRLDLRPDVTIVRDRDFGVPHVYGTTRAGTMFGAGYAAAQDRLFLMDVLRHVGRGELTPFAGGAPGNRQFEQDQWAIAPYTEEDLQRQADGLGRPLTPTQRQLKEDAQHYIDGINRYIAEQRLDVTKRPGEYFAINRPQGPADWNLRDVVATASLVGGIFGKGGGGEVQAAVVRHLARQRFGDRLGLKVWSALRSAEDPEAPTTVHRAAFPYPKGERSPSARALPDRGRVVPHQIVRNEVTLPAPSPAPPAPPAPGLPSLPGVEDLPLPTGTLADRDTPLVPKNVPEVAPLDDLLGGGILPPGGVKDIVGGASNALVVSGRESRSGHPLAVFGPQTSYFAPQLLLEQELQGPGISAKGASFVGVSMYVQLGRGRDYAWSATSAGQDITDTFAVELCEPDGSQPTLQSMHYVFRGTCTPIEVLRKRNTWIPNVADQTPPGSYVLEAHRTKLGLVSHRGTVGGKPVAFTRLRSTYLHEIDSGVGFQRFNNPDAMRTASDFKRAASDIQYTFNWFYANADQVAYFNSGANPVRAKGADPDLPAHARHEWKGFNPDLNTSATTPAREHPQVVDQAFLTSWNNKQARGFQAADDQWGFGPLYRVKPLDDRIARGIRGSRKMTREQLVEAMEDAGTVDLRGDAVLPWALKVIDRGGRVGDTRLRNALNQLRAWARSGAHRIDRNRDGRYDRPVAIRIMDAWWPRWIRAQFRPVLGGPLYDATERMLGLHDAPGQKGSAFQSGWYGYAQKDLRRVLGERVRGAYPVRFCGSGRLARCRELLLATLREAIDVPATDLYRRDGCTAGDQFCFDSVEHNATGGITHDRIHWINRPTFQQVIEFPRRR